MTDDVAQENPVRSGLSDDELRAIAYFAVGVGSEGNMGGRDVSNRLSFAGRVVNGAMVPVANSGFSIGTLQTDLGQRPQVAPSLVAAYQTWARESHPDWVLTDAQQEQTIRDLSRNGRTIRAEGGRQMDAAIKSHLDSFLESDAGINYVHNNDVAQADKLMTEIFEPLRNTALYRNATTDDQVRLATMTAKTYNQSERWGGRILDNIQADNYADIDGLKNAIGGLLPGNDDYMQSGRNAALQGAETLIALRNSDQRSPLHQPWQNVLANPLVNPTQAGQDAAHPNLGSEYAAVKDLFLRKENAPALIEALDRGGVYGHNITNSRGQSRPQSTSLYAAGDDFVVMDGSGIGKAYVGGTWSDVDRANLTRVNNRDGAVDLNINRDGTVERLLHVNPNVPVLRPVPQPAESAQPAPTDQQSWVPFIPTPMTAPAIASRSFGTWQGVNEYDRQRDLDADRAPSNAIPASGSIAPAIANPALIFPPPIPASNERELEDRENREREDRENREREQQTSEPVSSRGPFNDPHLDRAHAALMAGDSDQLDRLAIQFAQSPEGQQMAQIGNQLLAQQQLLEQQQLQEQRQLQEQQMSQVRRGPVMSL